MLEPLAPGTLLQGRYRVCRAIGGSGGIGQVYLAEDTRVGNRPRAVKELLDQFSSQADRSDALSLFHREVQMVATLRHQNLPEIVNQFEENGRQYIIMEYVDGETLQAVLDRSPGGIPADQVVAWAGQICDVVYYLHQQNPPVIFRDLKPAHVMLDKSGRLKLIDFGIARLFDPTKRGKTINMGTPGFAAPEQYGGGAITPRSDIFGLGATLHYLLTGQDPTARPFVFDPPHVLNPTVPVSVSEAVMLAVQMDPARRPASAREVKEAISQGMRNCRQCRQPNSVTAERCAACGAAMAAAGPSEGRPAAASTAIPSAAPFQFRGGEQAGTLAQLVQLCESKPDDAVWHLEAGHFESWLRAMGYGDAAQAASLASRQAGTSQGRLKRFLDATGIRHTYVPPEESASKKQPEERQPMLECEKCGRADDTLRATAFIYVISVLILTFKRGWAGTLCRSCRIKYGILLTMESLLLGPWGFPWGIIYTIQALFVNLRGGTQPGGQNARIMAYQGVRYLERGEIALADSCLAQSLSFEDSESIRGLRAEIAPRVQQQSVLQPPRGRVSLKRVVGLGLAGVVVIIIAALNVLGPQIGRTFGQIDAALGGSAAIRGSMPTPSRVSAGPTSAPAILPTAMPTAIPRATAVATVAIFTVTPIPTRAPTATATNTPLPLRQPRLTAEVVSGQSPKADGRVAVKVCWSNVDERANAVYVSGGDLDAIKNRLGSSSGCVNDVYVSGLRVGRNALDFRLEVWGAGQSTVVTAQTDVTAAAKTCPSNPALVEVRNDLDAILTLLLSGPENVALMVLPGGIKRVCLTPGTYLSTLRASGYKDKTGSDSLTSGACTCLTYFQTGAVPRACACSDKAPDYSPP
jgi:hypothetical protein